MWDPFKLKDYARQVGIRFENFDLFEKVMVEFTKAIDRAIAGIPKAA